MAFVGVEHPTIRFAQPSKPGSVRSKLSVELAAMHELSQRILHYIHGIFTMLEQLHGYTKAPMRERLQVSILKLWVLSEP